MMAEGGAVRRPGALKSRAAVIAVLAEGMTGHHQGKQANDKEKGYKGSQVFLHRYTVIGWNTTGPVSLPHDARKWGTPCNDVFVSCRKKLRTNRISVR
jgi:hypothetical protein